MKKIYSTYRFCDECEENISMRVSYEVFNSAGMQGNKCLDNFHCSVGSSIQGCKAVDPRKGCLIMQEIRQDIESGNI